MSTTSARRRPRRWRGASPASVLALVLLVGGLGAVAARALGDDGALATAKRTAALSSVLPADIESAITAYANVIPDGTPAPCSGRPTALMLDWGDARASTTTPVAEEADYVLVGSGASRQLVRERYADCRWLSSETIATDLAPGPSAISVTFLGTQPTLITVTLTETSGETVTVSGDERT